MNDDFLSRFRKAPPPEFIDALYNKINRRTTSLDIGSHSRLVAISALGMLIFLLLLFSFPEVQAYARQVLRFFTQAESSSFPLPLVDTSPQTAISEDSEVSNPQECGDFTSLNFYRCEFDKAELAVDFDIRELHITPDGLTFSKAAAYPSQQVVTLTYDCAGCALVITQVRSNGIDNVWASPWGEVPADAVEHIQVNGYSGEYVQGRFVSVDGTSAYWEPDAPSQRLRWREGEMSFEIRLDGNTGPVEYLDRESLISLAEDLK